MLPFSFENLALTKDPVVQEPALSWVLCSIVESYRGSGRVKHSTAIVMRSHPCLNHEHLHVTFR